MNSSILPTKVAYVLKRYPRYSETFVVNEILANEAAGLKIEIFSLYPPNDQCFQDSISRVRAPVHYLPHGNIKAIDFWSALELVSEVIPNIWNKLHIGYHEDSHYVYQALLLAFEVRTRGIQHLHSHFATSATSVTRLASFFAEVPYTFTAHAKDIFHESVRAEDLSAKIRDARAVITVSEYNLRILREMCNGNSPDRVRRIYNGLNLQQFAYHIPVKRPNCIVAVGRLIEKKGFSDLVDACRILADRNLDFRCEIIGVGEEEANLRFQIERNRLQDQVKLLGPLPQNEVIQKVQNAAVFAAPCVIGRDGNRDGLPTVLLEAMALGTPCVSTDVTGIPEAVKDQETGFIVPQHDPAALACSIEKLLLDPEQRVRISQSARQLIEQQFDIRSNAACLRELFKEVISQGA